MTPDLRFPHKSELDPQTQWDTFKEQLSYVLTYPDHEEPDTMDLPEMTDLYQATPINTGLAGFAKSLYAMREYETLGDENAHLIVISLDAVEIRDQSLIADLHQYIGVGESTETIPITVFFVQTNSSAAMILPVQIENDYIIVQVSPIKGDLESQVPALRKLQDYYDRKTKVQNTKRSIEELLKVEGIKRGSDLKKR